MANSLKDFFINPTAPALRDGAHRMQLVKVEVPDLPEDKTPYIIMYFKDLDNNQTYNKYMFENDCNFFSRHIKEMLDIAETTTPCSELCKELIKNEVTIPVFIHTVSYNSGLDNVLRTTKNWYFVTDYTPADPNAQVSSER